MISTFFELKCTSVFSVIITAVPVGFESATINLKLPTEPMNPELITSENNPSNISSNGLPENVDLLLLDPPNDRISPTDTALPKRLLFNAFGSALIMIPCCAGAIVIFFASLTSVFLTLTDSPIPVLAFLLRIPSILITDSPTSVG